MRVLRPLLLLLLPLLVSLPQLPLAIQLSQTQAGTGAFGGPVQSRLCAQPAAQPRGTTRGTRRGTTGRAPRSHHSRRASTSPREDTCRRGFIKCYRLTAVRAGGAVHRHTSAAFRPRAAAQRPRAGCSSCRCRGLGLAAAHLPLPHGLPEHQRLPPEPVPKRQRVPRLVDQRRNAGPVARARLLRARPAQQAPC
jgi:hypothetical protein